jgi:hypothetical protein
MGNSKDVMSVVYCIVSSNSRFTRCYQYVIRMSVVARFIACYDYATKTDMAFSRVCEYASASKHQCPASAQSERSKCPHVLRRFLQVDDERRRKVRCNSVRTSISRRPKYLSDE